MNTIHLPLKYSHLTMRELIKQADIEGNELAVALAAYMETASPACVAFQDALFYARTNMENALDNIKTALENQLACGAIEDVENFKLEVAQAWPDCLLDIQEATTLRDAISSSTECDSELLQAPDFLDTKNDFKNPFQKSLDKYEQEQKERRKAEKERRESLRINQPLPARKKRKQKGVL